MGNPHIFQYQFGGVGTVKSHFHIVGIHLEPFRIGGNDKCTDFAGLIPFPSRYRRQSRNLA